MSKQSVCATHPHKLGVLFVLAYYSWAQGLFCNVVDVPKVTPLEKTDIASCRRY